jgi:EAL domain-containing protein (putative c-di-GMP-specific phosphodiesterase class I)
MVSGRINGFEALLRWDHPTRGLLLPDLFMPIAERTGSVSLLGRWALDEACRQLKLWRDQGLPRPDMSVNVSAVQLKGGSDLVCEVRDAVTAWDVDPSGLELELTETVLMEATQAQYDSTAASPARRKNRHRRFRHRLFVVQYLTVLPLNRLKLARELSPA